MKKLVLLSGAALAVAGTAVTLASGSGSRTTSIHLREIVTNETFVDVGAKGTSQGDYVAWNDPLIDPASKKLVGHVQGMCVFVDVKQGLLDCAPVSFVLGGGTIYSEGLVSTKGVPTYAPITGGTKAYANTHGQIRIQPLSATKNDFVITTEG
jgi:hypothetical protein